MTLFSQELVASHLQKWIGMRLAPATLDALSALCDDVRRDMPQSSFQAAFSMVSRMVGRAALALDDCELAEAAAARPMWQPGAWTMDQAVRTLLLLCHDTTDRDRYLSLVHALFDTSDTGELVALCQALPLLPFPEHLLQLAEQGMRSNISVVFEAVALRNPYPYEYLDQARWNRMVLKAAFNGSRLLDITGISARSNPELACMLWNLVQERRSARRSYPADVWTLITPYADTVIPENDRGTAHIGELMGESRPAAHH